MSGSSDGVSQNPREKLKEREDVETVLLLNPGSIDTAIEDDEPMYFPHKERDVVFSVHAVPEDEVDLDDGWEFWHPDNEIGWLSKSGDYFVCSECSEDSDRLDDEMPVFPDEEADVEFDCLHCDTSINPSEVAES